MSPRAIRKLLGPADRVSRRVPQFQRLLELDSSPLTATPFLILLHRDKQRAEYRHGREQRSQSKLKPAAARRSNGCEHPAIVRLLTGSVTPSFASAFLSSHFCSRGQWPRKPRQPRLSDLATLRRHGPRLQVDGYSAGLAEASYRIAARQVKCSPIGPPGTRLPMPGVRFPQALDCQLSAVGCGATICGRSKRK